jgi:hypothetical protein
MIQHNGKTMLTEKRSPGSKGKPWTIDPYLTPLRQQEEETVNEYVNAALNHDNISNRIVFYHASLFSTLLTIWCDALYAGQFTTLPGPASAQVRLYPPHYIVMNMGHLDQQSVGSGTLDRVKRELSRGADGWTYRIRDPSKFNHSKGKSGKRSLRPDGHSPSSPHSFKIMLNVCSFRNL